jgi:hypothetical protein
MALGTARYVLPHVFVRRDVTHQGIMTMHAIVLQLLQIRLCNTNGFWKVLKRKRFGVIKTIASFNDVFFRKRVRHIAAYRGPLAETKPKTVSEPEPVAPVTSVVHHPRSLTRWTAGTFTENSDAMSD